MFSNESEPSPLNDPMSALLSSLEEKQDKKLEGFTVLDCDHQPIGKVRELVMLPDRAIHMVIDQSDSAVEISSFALSNKYILDVDPSTQTLTIGLCQVEIQQLPEYSEAEPDLHEAEEAIARRHLTASEEL